MVTPFRPIIGQRGPDRTLTTTVVVSMIRISHKPRHVELDLAPTGQAQHRRVHDVDTIVRI